MANDDQKAESRPENLSASSSESGLSEEEKDEQFDREFREKLTRGTNRKSRNEVTQRSSFSHTCTIILLLGPSDSIATQSNSVFWKQHAITVRVRGG